MEIRCSKIVNLSEFHSKPLVFWKQFRTRLLGRKTMSSQDDRVHMGDVLPRNSTSGSIQIPGTVHIRFLGFLGQSIRLCTSSDNQLTSFIRFW